MIKYYSTIHQNKVYKKLSSNNKINCPICHSKNIAEYLYGMPAFSKKLEKQLADKKIILGGCCIDEHSPTYHCNDCGQEWRDIEDKKWELVEGKVDTAEDHFKIRYGDINKVEPEEFILAALIGKGKNNCFIVELILPESLSKSMLKKIITKVKKEIEFYSEPRADMSPWEYAIYHCSTSSNIYSPVHWGYYPKGFKGK